MHDDIKVTGSLIVQVCAQDEGAHELTVENFYGESTFVGDLLPELDLVLEGEDLHEGLGEGQGEE